MRVSVKSFLAALIGVSSAQASVTVKPVSPYTFISSGTTLYYAHSDLAGDVDTAAGYVVINKTPATASSGGMVYLDLTTSLSPSEGQEILVTLYAADASSAFTQSVPIQQAAQYVGSTVTMYDCTNLTLSACHPAQDGANYFFSAIVGSGQTVRVGFYPSLICAKNPGGGPKGCSAGNELLADQTEIMIIEAHAMVRDASDDSLVVPSNASSDNKSSFSLVFSDSVPTIGACPADFSSLYFPGDGKIDFFPNQVSTPTASNDSVSVTSVLVAGAVTASFDNSSYSAFVSNPAVGRGALNQSSISVSGFTNSTPSDPNVFHTVEYVVTDAAGILSASACTDMSIRTADIRGFLEKGNCFIATATYQDSDALPVRMLREFRDRVLMRFSIGESFVGWYYEKSPEWAERLWFHPWARYVVLKALTPIEVVAWLLLHPLYWLMGVLGLGALLLRRRHELG